MQGSDEISDEVRAEIERRLSEVEAKHAVSILVAIESGSRAWGFPSPDSDYDVRFIYVHRPDWYLAIDSRRDVIELPIDLPYDVNGWDLRKALQLLTKANPVLLEWLQSPIRYRWNDQFATDLLSLAGTTRFAEAGTHHYYRLARTQFDRYIDGKDEVPLKKYFYVARPALALMWLRTRDGEIAPMSLPELMKGLSLPPAISGFLNQLVERKREVRELGSTRQIGSINEFITAELQAAKTRLAGEFVDNQLSIDQANSLFRKWIDHPSG